MRNDRVTALVQACKGVEPAGSGISFVVHDSQERVAGKVCALTPDIAADPVVLEQLTLWRRLNAPCFFSQFAATVERTQKWLETVVLPDPTRIMFLVEDEQGRRLGQFGLCGINSREAQLDNGIRGEAGGHPRLFYFVEQAVIHFAFGCLDVQRVFARFFSDNVMAMRLHKSMGLSLESTQFMKRTEHGDEVRFDIVAEEAESNTDIRTCEMSVQRAAFYLRHPGMQQNELLRSTNSSVIF